MARRSTPASQISRQAPVQSATATPGAQPARRSPPSIHNVSLVCAIVVDPVESARVAVTDLGGDECLPYQATDRHGFRKITAFAVQLQSPEGFGVLHSGQISTGQPPQVVGESSGITRGNGSADHQLPAVALVFEENEIGRLHGMRQQGEWQAHERHRHREAANQPG